MFDGDGFVRGFERKGRSIAGARVLVVGAGAVGSAIAASLAAAGPTAMMLSDALEGAAEALASRLQQRYPALDVQTGSRDPAGYDLIVNAIPLGMRDGDPLPFDTDRLAPETFVGEVVMKQEYTPLLKAAAAKGCRVQVGADVLFEMIPASLEFVRFGHAGAAYAVQPAYGIGFCVRNHGDRRRSRMERARDLPRAGSGSRTPRGPAARQGRLWPVASRRSLKPRRGRSFLSRAAWP